MDCVIAYLVKVNIIVAFTYLTYKLLFKNDTFFKLHRGYIIFGLLCAVTFPLLLDGDTFNSIPIKAPSEISPSTIGNKITVILTENDIPYTAHWIKYLAWTYLSISICLLITMCIRTASILNLRRESSTIHLYGRKIHIISEEKGAFSFFNWIFLSKENVDNTNIFRHELTHSRQWHTLDIVFGDVMTSLCWINPMAWLLLKEMKENLEFIADEEASRDSDITEYQALLVSMTAKSAIAKHYNNFNVSSLKKRIKTMNRKRTKKAAIIKYVLTLPFIIGIAYISSITLSARDIPTHDTSRTETLIIEGLRKHLMSTIKYPISARNNNHQGNVIATFRISDSGKPVDIEINEGSDSEFASVVLESLNNCPSFDGQYSTDASVRIPFMFRIYGQEEPTTPDDIKNDPNSMIFMAY